MRPNGSGIMYVAVLIVSVALAICFTLPWFDPQAERLPVGLPIAAAGVALYSTYQLLRPAPRMVEDDPPEQ
jgi:hypothetical protein